MHSIPSERSLTFLVGMYLYFWSAIGSIDLVPTII